MTIFSIFSIFCDFWLSYGGVPFAKPGKDSLDLPRTVYGLLTTLLPIHVTCVCGTTLFKTRILYDSKSVIVFRMYM